MLKFLLVAGLVGTWAAPVKDILVSRQDGSSLEDDILGLSNLDEDSKLWSAFYCEGANYGGQCITQQYSNGECTPIEPPLCENVLSFLATSSNCVLYEGDDCTGSAIPVYSSAQDLHPFRKTNSYKCGLSSAQVAAQLIAAPPTSGAHSPAPVHLVSVTSTESATLVLAQPAKETSIVDTHETLHASAVTSTGKVVPPVSESTTSRTDDTPAAVAADATASSVPIPSSLPDDPHRQHRHPKYVTVTETATRVVSAYVATTETSTPSSVTRIPSPAEASESAPSSTRTTNTEGSATSSPPHHHRLPKYVTVTETATRTLDAYVTPSTTVSEQTSDKGSTAPGILTTSTSVDVQPLPLASSSVGSSASGASDTSQVVGKSGISIASSPTSSIVHDGVDAAVSAPPLPTPSLPAPSTSVISPAEPISLTVVSSEVSTSESHSSTSDSIKHSSTGFPSPSEGTDVVSGHETNSPVKGGTATTGPPAPTQLHDNVPSEASPAVPAPIPSASTTSITDKLSAAPPSIEHASTGVSSLPGIPTVLVSVEPVGHSESISNVTPVETPSSLPSPTSDASNRPSSSREPNDHVAVTPETLPTSSTLSPPSVSIEAHTTSAITAKATALVEPLASTPALRVDVASSDLASTSITPASTEAPKVQLVASTRASTVHIVVPTDQLTEDVKTTITHRIANPTVTSISTPSTRKNEGLGGSHEDGPSHLPVDTRAAITDVLPTSSAGIPPKKTASASDLQAPLPTPSPTQISDAVQGTSRTYHDTASSVIATHSFSSTQVPEGEGLVTVTTSSASSFAPSGQPSTSTISYTPSPATGTSAVADQIPSPHILSTRLTGLGAATPPPHSPEDEVLVTVTVHQVTSLGAASTNVPTSISVDPTATSLPLLKDDSATTVTVGASSTVNAPSSIGSPGVIETPHVTYDAPPVASSLLSTPSIASHTDHKGVAPTTVDQSISGFSPLAAQSASVVSPSTSVVHAPSRTRPSASPTDELASSPTPTIQPEGETVIVTVHQTTIPGPIITSTAAQPLSSVISTSRVLPIANPSESSSALGGGLTSTPPSGGEAIATNHPTPTTTDHVASRPLSSISPPSDAHTSDEGHGYVAIHEPTSFGSIEISPSSIQATPTSALHLTSHTTDDEGTAYVTVTSSILITTPTASAKTTIPGPPPEALATAKYPHVTNEGADVTSAPISPEEIAVHRTTSTTGPPTPPSSNNLVSPSSIVSAVSIQPSEATDLAHSTTPLSFVARPMSSSISTSTSTPTADSMTSDKAVISHPTSSKEPSEVVRPDQETTIYGGISGLPTSVHEPASMTTSYTAESLPPITSTNPTRLLPSHTVANDDDLVYVTVHRTTAAVSTPTPVHVASQKIEESVAFAPSVTSSSSSIASSTASGAPGEGPVYATSRALDSASDTPTSVPNASTVPLPSTTAVLGISTVSVSQDGLVYTTIQQSVTTSTTSTTISKTLGSVSSPSHVVDDESLVYVTIHRTRTLGAPLAPLSTSVASVSSGAELPTITRLLASSIVSPQSGAEKESLAYVTGHTPAATHSSLAVVSHTVDEGAHATAESTTTVVASSPAPVMVTPSVGTPTRVEVEGPSYVTVQQSSTGSKIVTNVAENTGDANDIPVLPPTSTPSTSYVSAGSGSGAPMTATEQTGFVQPTVASVGSAASATSLSRILSTKKDRFTTVRYAGTRTSTPTTTAPYGSTSVTATAPVERTGTKTVNTGDLDDIPVRFTSTIPTPPYASSSGTVIGTIEQFKSTAVEPVASFGTTIASANVTTSTEPATSSHTFVSSELPGGASTFTSTIIVIPPSRSTGAKAIVVDNTGDSDDIPVLPATPTPSISTTHAPVPSLGTKIFTTGLVEATRFAALKPATSAGATPTEEPSEIGGPTHVHPATTTTSFVSSEPLERASAYTSTHIAVSSTESTGTKTIAAASPDDSDDIPVLRQTTSPVASRTAPPSESTTVKTTVTQDVDAPVLSHTASLTVSPPSHPVRVVSVSYTSPVETVSPYVSAPSVKDALLITETVHPASSATSPVTSSVISSATGTSLLTVAGVESASSVISHVSETTSIPSTSAKENQNTSVVTSSTSESAPVTSSSLTAASIINTQVQSTVQASSSSPQVTHTPLPTPLPITTAKESQGLPSFSETASIPSSSPTLATAVRHPLPIETASISSTFSVLASVTPTPSPAAATVTVTSLLETVSIPPPSSIALSTKSSATASSESPIAASTIDTPTSVEVAPSNVIPTLATTLLPFRTTKASASTPSLLQTTSVSSPSPTLAITEHPDLPSSVEIASSVLASPIPDTTSASPTPGSATTTVSAILETVSISSSTAFNTKSSQYTSATVVSPAYSQRTLELESASSAPSSFPITTGVIDTQTPTTSISLPATYTSTPTLSPIATTKESQSTSSLLSTASAPAPSPTLVSVEQPDIVETVSILSVSVSSVSASATPVPSSGAATIAVSSPLGTAPVSIPSPAAAVTKNGHNAPSAAVSSPDSQLVASSVGVSNPTSSTAETVSTPCSSPVTAAIKDTPPSIAETATLSAQPTPLVQGSSAPISSPAAATRKEFSATPIPTPSLVTTIVEDKQSGTPGGASPAPSVSSMVTGEGAHPSSSTAEVPAAPSSSHSTVVVEGSSSSSSIEINYVTHQSISSLSVTATPAAATPVSSSVESTSSPAPAQASVSFKDRLVSPHASAVTGVKDMNSPIESKAPSAPTVLTTTPSPSIIMHSDTTPTPTHTHHHDHHNEEEEEEIVYVTIVTTTTVTEPVCTTTTYPTETVTQTVMTRGGLEVIQPTRLPNGR
ncbi:hypothetical protein AB1N83_005418 [Pleurotus pulmonarius]